MINIKASPGKIKANMLIRDSQGRPKIDYDKIPEFYPRLYEEDKKLVREAYPDHPYFTEGDT